MNNTLYTQEMIDEIRSKVVVAIAEQITSVQPMQADIWDDLLLTAADKQQLIIDGYVPVSEFELLWKKDKI